MEVVSAFLTLPEASEEIRTPVRTLRLWIAQGRLVSYRPGRRVLVKREELIALVESTRRSGFLPAE